MKRLLSAAGLVFALAATAACGKSEAATTASPAEDAVARGKYLVSAIGCSDCHTPLKMGPQGPEPDMSRLLSGHPEGMKLATPPSLDPKSGWGMVGASTATAFSGPWGISYAMNLTPDVNTGLGIWTEEMFLKAIREGRHMGQSRPIMPPMPWSYFRNLTDGDLKSVYAYLRSIPAVHNRVPDYQPPPDPQE